MEIAVAKPDGSGFAKLTHQAPGGSAPHWAANGRSIVFQAGSQLWRMTPRGTRLHQIRSSGEPSPSATRFARLLKHGVDIVSAKGRLVRRIRLPLGRNDYYDSVLWSSDSGSIAIGVGTEDDNADYSRVFMARVEGHEPARALSRRIRRGERDDFPIAWSRDGGRLLLHHATGSRHEAHIVDFATGTRRKVRGEFLHTRGRWYAASPDLASVAFVSKSGPILIVPLRGGRARVLTRHKGAGLVTWSLSGRKLAYVDKDGIYVVNRDGSQRRRITSIAQGASPPEWSPNGARVAFSVGYEAIYVVKANGSGLKLLTRSVWDDSPQWSPDGSKVAFLRGPNGLEDPRRLRIVVMKRDGKGQRMIGRGYGPR